MATLFGIKVVHYINNGVLKQSFDKGCCCCCCESMVIIMMMSSNDVLLKVVSKEINHIDQFICKFIV